MNFQKHFLITVLGAVLGIIGARFVFVGSALSLIPWGLVGLYIGYQSHGKKDSFYSGAVYGFFLAFVFMLSGYSGTKSIVGVLIPFALLGLFGAVCGVVLSFIGNFIRNIVSKRR